MQKLFFTTYEHLSASTLSKVCMHVFLALKPGYAIILINSSQMFAAVNQIRSGYG